MTNVTVMPKGAMRSAAGPPPEPLQLPKVTREDADWTDLRTGQTRREVSQSRTVDGRWLFLREEDDQTSWTAVYMLTGQRRYGLGSELIARSLAHEGTLLREFRQQDREALAGTCVVQDPPCTNTGAALIDTKAGRPVAVCDEHTNFARTEGYTVRYVAE